VRRRAVCLACILAAAGSSAALAAEAAYVDAWSPETVAAAEAAVARLGPSRGAVGLRASVLSIPALTAGIGGGSTGLVASVQELEAAKRDLGAQETALEVRVELPADVLFDFDKADIRSDAADALAKLAAIIAAYPRGRVELSGHTDSQGSDAYNLALSQRRASAVKDWLVRMHALDGARIAPRGEGEARPVADNATEAGRQRNRRVEALIHKE
jgi:outer membrane protein OmpA-like peptidoglycan-associated protein